MLSPIFSPATELVKGNDAKGSARRVEADVGPAALAAGNEGLVEFVGGSIERGNEPSKEGGFVVPTPPWSAGPQESAGEKPRQHSVLRNVRGLSHEKNDLIEPGWGNIRYKEFHDRANDARRVVR